MKCAAGHCRLVEGILAVQGRGGCQDAYSIPDQFTVSTFDGIVFGTPGLVSDSGTQNLNIPRNGILVVSVNAPLDDTAWEYNLSCPN